MAIIFENVFPFKNEEEDVFLLFPFDLVFAFVFVSGTLALLYLLVWEATTSRLPTILCATRARSFKRKLLSDCENSLAINPKRTIQSSSSKHSS